MLQRHTCEGALTAPATEWHIDAGYDEALDEYLADRLGLPDIHFWIDEQAILKAISHYGGGKPGSHNLVFNVLPASVLQKATAGLFESDAIGTCHIANRGGLWNRRLYKPGVNSIHCNIGVAPEEIALTASLLNSHKQKHGGERTYRVPIAGKPHYTAVHELKHAVDITDEAFLNKHRRYVSGLVGALAVGGATGITAGMQAIEALNEATTQIPREVADLSFLALVGVPTLWWLTKGRLIGSLFEIKSPLERTAYEATTAAHELSPLVYLESTPSLSI
jgi:hypothetical protein